MESHVSVIPLVLASASPRRVALLTQLGWQFRQLSADIDESPRANESPLALVERLAREKAQHVAAMLTPPCAVLGADTLIDLDNKVLGKPQHEQQSLDMLRQLSGRSHWVHTAIALVYNGQCQTQVVSTQVCFSELSDAQIRAYWASGEPQDKAGSYAIQGLGGNFIKTINGSYSAVVGLPLVETQALLNSLPWR